MKWLGKLMAPLNKTLMPVLVKSCFCGTDFVSVCASARMKSRRQGRRVVRGSLSEAGDVHSSHHAKSISSCDNQPLDSVNADVNLLKEVVINCRYLTASTNASISSYCEAFCRAPERRRFANTF